MNSLNGEIKEFPSLAAAEKEGFSVPLTDLEAMQLKDMSPDERMGWLASRRGQVVHESKEALNLPPKAKCHFKKRIRVSR